uniref:mRNA capping enzyme n=1 Tax=Pithovirus LCPAC001 TaxID=2506585 RepID=A0A481Z4X6_9VIRU|nr:MAG: mRNA capping enzyme [Pithovirus LCPAC001]
MTLKNKSLREEIIRYDPDTLKLEVKFESYHGRITKTEVTRLTTYFKNPEIINSREQILYQQKNNLVRSEIEKKTLVYTKITFLKKINSSKYPFKLVLNQVITLSSSSWDYSQHSTDILKKTYEYIIGKGYVTLIIYELFNSEKESTTYEILLRLNSENLDNNGYKEMDQQILWIMKILYGTSYLYTSDQYLSLIETFNSLGPHDFERSKIVSDNRIVLPVRNIHTEDLVQTGIIGNSETVYTVSLKIKGDRRFFIIHNSSIWLLDPVTSSVNKIMPSFQGTISLLFEKLNGMVLDGVLVSTKTLRKDDQATFSNYDSIYYVTDILNVGAGNKLNVMKKPYINSMDASNQRYNVRIIKLLQQNFIKMTEKLSKHLAYKIYIGIIEQKAILNNKLKNRVGNPIGGFSAIMANMLGSSKKLIYETDGLIFRPNNGLYEKVKVPEKDRVLTKTMEVCQWTSGIILNLLIRKNRGNYMLYTRDDIFVGTPEYQYTPSMLDYSHSLFKEINDFDVVEFIWDREFRKLTPIKISISQSKADKKSVAIDNWKYMNNPIAEETLTGNDNMFFVYYHRDLRKKILIESADIFKYKPDLIDLNVNITSIKYWKSHYSRVIGFVNNDEEYIYDIQTEIRNIYDLNSDVPVIYDVKHIKPFNSPIILVVEPSVFFNLNVKSFFNKKADVIVNFYGSEQWWSSKTILNRVSKSVTRNLSSDGIYSYIIFNGDNLDPNLDGIPPPVIAFDGNNLYEQKDNKIVFNLEVFPELPYLNGTVNKTHLDDLILNFQSENLILNKNKRCDGLLLLNERSYLLSALFNYGNFSKNDKETSKKSDIKSKFAYVVLIMNGDSYIPGMITVGSSLKMTGTKHDLVLLHTSDISEKGLTILKKSGIFDYIIPVKYLKYTFSPSQQVSEFHEKWMNLTYTKWNILKLTQYEKVIFVDGDMIVDRNMDNVFELDTPSANFSYRYITERPKRLFSIETANLDRIFIKYPVDYGDKIKNSMVMEGLKTSHVLNAGLVCLSPSQEKYDQMIAILETTDVFGFGGRSGADEQIIAYLYIRDQDPNQSVWTTLGDRYNALISKPDRLLKAGSVYDYKDPTVLHFTGKTKPWTTSTLKGRLPLISDKIWMYYFWSAIQNSKLHFSMFKDLVDPIRLKYIQTSRNIGRFRFDVGWFDQRMFPWALNDGFEPKILRKNIKRTAYIYYVDENTQMAMDAIISAVSIERSGAGSDKICIVNSKVSDDTISLLRKSKLFNWIDVVDEIGDGVERWQCLNYEQYYRIMFINSSTIVYKLISFLFDLEAPAGIFSDQYKHGHKIPNRVINRNLRNGNVISDALVVLKPSSEDYDELIKIYKNKNKLKLVSSTEAPLYMKVLSWLYTKTDQKIWTNISSIYNQGSRLAIKSKSAKVRAVHSPSGKWSKHDIEKYKTGTDLWYQNLKELLEGDILDKSEMNI